MAQQTINIGAAPDDGTGDTLRVGGDKINDNFTELYAADAALGTAAPLDVDPDDTLAADSDSLIPTQQAVKAYVDANVGGSVAELDDVGDVNAPAPANGDVLTWDSTPGEWVAAAPTGGSNALDDLTDVDAPTPADGDVLTFDSGSGDWVPSAPAGGGGALQLITETVTTGSATNVSFTSIAATWRDLEFRVTGRGTTAAALVGVRLRFNGDTGNNYDQINHQLNNTTTTGFPLLAQAFIILGNLPAASATANYADLLTGTVGNYRGTVFQKMGFSLGGIRTGTTASTLYVEKTRFWWRNTAAITQIDIFPSAGAFVDGTVISLYGRM